MRSSYADWRAALIRSSIQRLAFSAATSAPPDIVVIKPASVLSANSIRSSFQIRVIVP